MQRQEYQQSLCQMLSKYAHRGALDAPCQAFDMIPGSFERLRKGWPGEDQALLRGGGWQQRSIPWVQSVLVRSSKAEKSKPIKALCNNPKSTPLTALAATTQRPHLKTWLSDGSRSFRTFHLPLMTAKPASPWMPRGLRASCCGAMLPCAWKVRCERSSRYVQGLRKIRNVGEALHETFCTLVDASVLGFTPAPLKLQNLGPSLR